MDARNFFAKTKPPLRLNQFGGAFGGPIRKDKTHFFASWEQTRQAFSDAIVSTVPALAQRAGDFSAISSRIYDPFTLANGVKQPFSVRMTRGDQTYEVRFDEIKINQQIAKSEFDFPNLSGQPLPDIPALLQDLQANEDRVEKLLDTYSEEDPAYAEVRAMLLRAQVFTSMQLKKRGLAKKAMDTLAEIEPGMLAAFTMKGTQPEIIQLARQTLAQAGFAPKMKIKRS